MSAAKDLTHFIEVPDWETRLKAVKIIISFLNDSDREDVRNILRSKGFSNTRIAEYITDIEKGLSSLPKRRLRRESNGKRWKILKRDKFTCQYCGRSAPDVELHVDHKKPIFAGGNSEESNLITACSDCNLGKNKDV